MTTAHSTVTTLGDITGKYGTYHMQANGDYTYDLDNSNPAVQALAVGATLPDPISYAITDAAGNTATAKLTTTITGTNDAPVLSVGQTTNITGTLTAVDLDTGDTHTFAVVHGAGSYGKLTVDPTTGAYTFAQNQSVIGMSLDKTSGKYTGNEVFEVKVTDNHGGTQSKFINFTSEVTLTAPTHTGSSGNQVPTPNVPPIVTPAVPNPPVVTDTKPVIASVTVPNAVTIDLSKTTDSGTSDQDKITNNPKPEITGHTDVPFSKVDILEHGKVIGSTISGPNGNYSITEPLTDGVHTLTAQATGPSVTAPVTSSPLAITIDTSIKATDDTDTATEDQAPGATSGNVLGNDDKNSTVTTLGDITGKYGTYHMQANGDYTYDLDNKNPAVQALAVGAKLPDAISYTMTDVAGNTATAKLTTTITGTNDTPVLSVGQTTNITGTLTAVDPDTGDTHTFAVVHGAGSYGTLTVDPTTGAYTFAQNQSVIGMSLDKTSGKYTGNEVFEVKVTDNHGGTQRKFINFTSEVTLTAPTHTGSSGNQVPTPNVPPILTPTVPNPPVVTDTKPVITSVTVPNTVTIDLSKTTDSGTSDQDKITNNPKPEITGHTDVPFSKVDILENGNVIGHAFSDKLGNYSIAVPLPTEGAHTLTAQATGPSLTTHVTSSPLAITIDTTALAKDDTNTATEDQAPGATSGNVLTNDDTNSTVTTLGDIKGQYGTYHMQASGDYTYDLDNTNPAVQALAVGATLPDTVNYTITDAAGNTATAKLTTTITGTNDAPVLTVGQTTNITGTLTGVDIDTGDILTFEVVHGVGHYGRLDVDSSTGAYTFVQNTSVAGMSLDSSSGKYSGKDAFEVKVTDNHGGTQSKFITFTSESTLTAPTHLVNGSQVPIPNAHPVVTPSVPNQPVVTDTKPTIPKVTVPNGVTIDLAKTSDTGSSDHDNITNNPKPEIIGHTDVPFSTVEILEKGKVIGNGVSDHNGHYSIIAPLGSGIHNLTAHATGPSITTQVSSSPLKITIDTTATATDDTDTATEDQAPGATSGDVLANDEQYSIVTSVGNIPGTYGMYHMQANGQYTYDLDNTNPAVQALAEGATLPDPISYTMTDAAGNTATAKLTTTITGTNDTPTLSVGQTSHIAGTLTAVDPDTGDTHTFAVVNGAGSYGTLTVDPSTGAYTFVQNQSVTGMTLDPSGVKYSGENAFEVKVTDNHGATHSKFITFTSESTLAAPTHTDSSGNQVPTPNLPPIITSSVPNQPVVTDTNPVIPNAHVANAVSIDLSAKTDTGISDHDKLTNNPNPEITGKTAVPFSKVDILENGNVIGHAFSDKLGNYSIAVPLPTEGLHTLTAQATGPSLTTSVISAPLAITIDTSINAKDETATTDEDHAASISGRVSDNDDHGHGEIFTATSNLDTGLGLYTLQSDGSYTFTVNTTKTSYLAVGESVQATLTYEVTDLAGNTAQAHLITTIEGRNDAPVLSIYHATEFNKGPISVHDDDMNDKHQYEVTTPIGRFGYLVITPDHLQGHTADYEYRQMGSPSVANMQYDNSKGIYSGSEVFEVKAKDGHGGESVQYITFHIQATVTPSVGGLPPVIHVTYPIAADITTNAPSMMPITPPVNAVTIDLDAKSDSGSNNADKITDITTPEIIGHTDIPNSKVEILNNGTVVATTYSGANGDYSVQTSDLGSAGLHTLTAQASGPSATTPVTSSLAITIDPNAPISHTDDVTIVLEAGSDTGIDAHDNITNDNTPTVAGLTNNPNALVEIIEHGKVIATTTADSTGFYTVDVPALGNGAHSLVAKVTLGTSVTLSATPLNVLIDTTINAADDNAIIDETTTSMISGSVISNDDHAQGETVMATTPLITSHGVYTLDPDGSYTFTIDKDATKNIAAGNHEEDTLTYEITDAAGNTASAVLTTSINADGAMYNIVTTAHDTSDDAPEALNLDINESNSISSFSLPTHDSSMLNLDNVEHSLEITKTTEPDVAHDTLAVVATLISDARENSKNDLIIKAVENKEEKAHVNNPDASAKEHGGDHSDNTHDTSTNTVELAYGNHQPAHNSNEDNDDGTGLT
ncbi:MAG: VCBS domain-containing protein [Candidatus Endonucleobacter sp. (ex Gigantidas childressi)]|nr:VCBS domain-containing protein [Candidatus Endonucleobacter sp. (ex Gigantidas childressi)]